MYAAVHIFFKYIYLFTSYILDRVVTEKKRQKVYRHKIVKKYKYRVKKLTNNKMSKELSIIEKYFIVKEDNGLSESMEKAYEVKI